MLDFIKDTQNSPFPWFNALASLEKLCQAVVARNDLANLQPTLNKGDRGGSLTIFLTDCRYQIFDNFDFFDQICLKRIFPIENGKIALVRVFMVVTYDIKLFRSGGDRHNGILMCLLLLVAETINFSKQEVIKVHQLFCMDFNHPARLGCHKYCGRGDQFFLIYHVTSGDHVFKGLCGLIS